MQLNLRTVVIDPNTDQMYKLLDRCATICGRDRLVRAIVKASTDAYNDLITFKVIDHKRNAQ